MGRISERQREVVGEKHLGQVENVNKRDTRPRNVGREISQSRGLISGNRRKLLQVFDQGTVW